MHYSRLGKVYNYNTNMQTCIWLWTKFNTFPLINTIICTWIKYGIVAISHSWANNRKIQKTPTLLIQCIYLWKLYMYYRLPWFYCFCSFYNIFRNIKLVIYFTFFQFFFFIILFTLLYVWFSLQNNPFKSI